METLIQLGDGEAWAEDSGGDGWPVVLLHPGWGDSTIWDEVVELLQGEGIRLIRYDARGYGRSPAPTGPFSALGDLVAVLDRHGADRAIILGHGSGGAIAISLALAHPERVLALILVAPCVTGYPWPQDDAFNVEYHRLTESGDTDGLLALGLLTLAPVDDGPAARAQIQSGIAGFAAQRGFVQPDPEAFHRLEEITVPAGVVLGYREYPMLADCADAVASRIPGCHIMKASEVDHMVPLRMPGLLAGLIRSEVMRADDPGFEPWRHEELE